MSAVSLFTSRIAASPKRIAVRHHELGIWSPFTWAELGLQAARLADGLAMLGVKRGDTVALVMANHPSWIAADVAIQSIGAVCLAIDPDSSAETVCAEIETAGAVIALCGDQEQFDKVDEQQQQGRAGSVRMRVVSDTRGMRLHGALRADAETTMSFADLQAKSTAASWTADHAGTEPSPDTVAFISKDTAFTHGDVLAFAAAAHDRLGLGHSDRLLAAASFADPVERSFSLTGLLQHGFTLAIGEGGPLARDERTAVQPTLFNAPDGLLDRVATELAAKIEKSRGLNRLALSRGWRPRVPGSVARPARKSVLQLLGLACLASVVLWLWLTSAWTDQRRIFGAIGIALVFGLLTIAHGAAVTAPLRRQLGLKRVRAVVGRSSGIGAQMLGALGVPLVDPTLFSPSSKENSGD